MRILPVAALLLLALGGCRKGPSVVGKWTAQANGGSLEVEFKEDGTFSWSTAIRGKTIAVRGDYKLDGESLALTRKEIDAPSLLPAEIARAKAAPAFGKPLDARVAFISGDEIRLSGLSASIAPGRSP